MPTNHIILRLLPLAFIGFFVAAPRSALHAQHGMKMSMSVKQDDETTQLIDDAMNRRVVMSPDHGLITRASKMVTIEVYNPTADTLTVDLMLSDTIVGVSRFVSRESNVARQDKSASKPTQTTGKTLLADDSGDSITSIFRPMSAWVRDLPASVSLAPGERKSVTVRVEIPETSLKGEYATWVVGEVRPRKTATQPKQVVYTISKVKLTHDTEQNADSKQMPATNPASNPATTP